MIVKTTPKYLTLLLAASLSLAGCDKLGLGQDQQPASVVKPVETKVEKKAPATLPDFAKLVEQEGSAVVNIQAYKDPVAAAKPRKDNEMDLNQFPDNDPFYEFFKRLVPNTPDVPHDEGDNDQNFGSGFIISPDGYILTNTHVVSGLDRIKVTLNDKREFIAKLIGSDPQTDVALLKIDAKNLSIVKIGNPRDLKPGEWVAAIGAPFGFDNSITSGIVSAKGRSLPNENYTPFIQTDVAINPGNSGGPLFNLDGQVIGINSQIYSRNGVFMGISFAIPIDIAMNVVEQLKATGKVQRGQLGVIIQEVSYDLAKSFKLDKPTGALIAKVLPGSPAAKAGLQVGDIVRSVNGETVRTSSELPVMVGNLVPGKEITLGVWRNGKENELKVMLGAATDGKDEAEIESGNILPQSIEAKDFAVEELGMNLREISNNEKKYLVVTNVSGVAQRAGIRRGDKILSIAQSKVEDEAGLRTAIAGSGKNIPLLVERKGTTLFLALNLQ
ncbi:DegQ family serine endoprotease [Neisseria wadsworthii]|uniref:Probable periplasmic serine endoprotease DegP-like n=1 Tax=Neisseria wadsworthii 9715 TaxID=1030841 RepID=G4CS86_9NEIS|nr:DegQ family serine endoprotease [Neisseria wadsworthii]EGZ44831.1 S1C subfamily peptidase MucD [Neisseria wadsworthii 9715]QMT35591.1 DegQ family serine endoprotease [Neisseria wadsworthii]